jgi:hypothetical protein
MLTLIFRHLLGPQGPHQSDGLFDDPKPIASSKSVVLGLLPVVPESDPEDHSPVGQIIERRQGFRQGDRVMLGHKGNCRAHLQFRRGGNERTRDIRVERPLISLENGPSLDQHASVDGGVSVLREGDGPEASRLGLARHFEYRHRAVCGRRV